MRARQTGVGIAAFRHLVGLDALAQSGRLGHWEILILRDASQTHDPAFLERWRALRSFALVDVDAPHDAHPASDLWMHGRLPGLLRRMGAAVLYSPAFVGPVATGSSAHVVMVHDDMVWSQPGSYPWRFRAYLSAATRLATWRADRVLFPSGAALRACSRRLGLSRGQCGVVHHGVPRVFFSPVGPGGARERLVVCIASAEPRKNHEVLARALANRSEVRLLFVGFQGAGAAGRLARLRRLAGSTPIEVIEAADETRVAGILGRAGVVALPSRGEGFGFPVLEGMAAGTPLVLSDLAVFREVAGECALYRDPDDVGGWARALEVALAGGASVEARVACGRKRAARMTLEASARALLRECARAYRQRRARTGGRTARS